MPAECGDDATQLGRAPGYRPQDRLLIINCDDLGSSHSANVAVYRSMVYGVATSATLMVPCPWAREAAQMFKGFPIGVHLTLTSEHPGYRWRSLTSAASLCDDEGFLPATTNIALEQIAEADARAECRAQIKTALAWGVDVTHLDTHMNVMQARTDLYEIYLDLAEEFRLPVRMFSRSDTVKQGFQARERAQARGLLFNEHIVYPMAQAHTGRLLRTGWAKISLKPGGTFGISSLDGEELRAYDTRNADIRAHDAACLMDPTVSDLLDQHNIKRISFRELRALQRGD